MTSKANKAKTQSLLDCRTRKERFRMYKDGKRWVVAGVVTCALGFGGLLSLNSTFAATKDTADAATTTEQAKSDTVNTGEDAQSTPASHAQTDALADSNGKLSDAKTKAENTGVNVTTTDTTVTTTPQDLSKQVALLRAKNALQEAYLQAKQAVQEKDNADYNAAKAAYDQQVVTIAPTNPNSSEWNANQLTHFLAGESGKDDSDVGKNPEKLDNPADADTTPSKGVTATSAKVDMNSEPTEAEKAAASEEAKKVAKVGLTSGDVEYVAPTDKTFENGNKPTWRYNNAFIDPQTGKGIDVVETVTDVVPENGSAPTADPYSDSIGFQPHNVLTVTAELSYFYTGTNDPATIDALIGIGDLDGYQGATVDNSYVSELHGRYVDLDPQGVYRGTKTTADGKDENGRWVDANNEVGQLWALQKGVTKTVYTFYNTNRSGHYNSQPDQALGNVDFGVTPPKAPVKKIESANLTNTTIKVNTNYTVHYTGSNGRDLPPDHVTPVTWTGAYDAETETYSWTPDQESIDIVTPQVEGYFGAPADASWSLGTITTDPADQQQTVTYSKTGEVGSMPTKVPLIVQYVDMNGDVLQPETQQTGDVGQSFTVTAPNIPGHILVNQSQKTTTGTYNGNVMTLTLVYRTVPGTVTPGVPGQPDGGTGTGTELPPAPNTSNEPGGNPPTTPDNQPGGETPTTPDGNTPKTPDGDLPNTFNDTPTKTAQDVPANNLPSTGTFATRGQAQAVRTVASRSRASVGTRRSAALPQTGDQHQSILAALGMALAAGLSVFAFGKRRQRN